MRTVSDRDIWICGTREQRPDQDGMGRSPAFRPMTWMSTLELAILLSLGFSGDAAPSLGEVGLGDVRPHELGARYTQSWCIRRIQEGE